MPGGLNGPAIVNGGDNDYDRSIGFDAPVAYDTGLYVNPSRTLGELRGDLAAMLGMGDMTTLSAGSIRLFNLWLSLAQSQQYYRYSTLRTLQWFAWQLQPGRRFYDTPIDGTKALNFRQITYAGIADSGGIGMTTWQAATAYTAGQYVLPVNAGELMYEVTVAGTSDAAEPTWPTAIDGTVVDGGVTFTARARPAMTWIPLRQGIDPLDYTAEQHGMPTHFDVGEYLEVWPTPDQPYVVWLKGHIGLKRFTDDADEVTIDHEVVLLFAAAMAKAHYRQPDANIYAQMCERMTRELTAASHGVRRYMPRGNTAGLKPEFSSDEAPWPQPRATWR